MISTKEQRNLRLNEIRNARAWLSSKNLNIKDFESKSLIFYIIPIIIIWLAIIVLTLLASQYDIALITVSILIIGYLQRALGNLYHDFSHGGFRCKKITDIVAIILIGCPLLLEINKYRANHNAHHAFLGEEEKDPDFIHDLRLLKDGSIRAYLRYISNRKIWFNSLSGHLFIGTIRSKILIIFWWFIALFIVQKTNGTNSAILFFFLWFSARGTSFHLLTTFREMADHVGMKPGGLISFTRNSPYNSSLCFIFHPFQNGLHIAHHLFPLTPYYKIAKLHQILLGYQAYAEAENCQTYFIKCAVTIKCISVFSSFSKHVMSQSEIKTVS